MNAKITSLLFVLAPLLGAILFSSCTAPRAFTWESIAFDTEVTVQAYLPHHTDSTALAKELSDETLRMEKLYSLYLEDSKLSKLNKTGIQISQNREFTSTLERAISYGRKTQGLFDVTTQPLWNWHTLPANKRPPLNQVLSKVDYKKIRPRSEQTLPKGMQLTFNGFIQGTLTDHLTNVLKRHGIKHALINAGEYSALGKNHGTEWELYVQGKNGVILDSINLPPGHSLAVSAGYGYSFNTSRKAKNHLFHPKNGSSSPTNLTVVVIAKSAELADVIATTCAISNEKIWKKLMLDFPAIHSIRVYHGKKLKINLTN